MHIRTFFRRRFAISCVALAAVLVSVPFGVKAGESTSDATGATSASTPGLEEIVVTAQKRTERLQDVPVPVTVISADSLLENNEFRLQDYYSSVPGLAFQTGVSGQPFLAIRGLTTGGYQNPTVGITVDDIPYGSSTGQGGGWSAPDIDPSN